MATRKEYLNTIRLRYKKAKTKLEKGKIITEVMLNLNLERKHVIKSLNKQIKRKSVFVRRRPQIYGFDLIKPLTFIWETFGKPCSKRLKPNLKEYINVLERFNELALYPKQKQLLLNIGTSSIDKLLGPIKRKHQGKGISGTKRSPLLKTLIPIRTNFDEVNEEGHLELDSVLHCGTSLNGVYAQTLNILDIHTHWNEKSIFLNKNTEKTVSSLHLLRKNYPFVIKSIDFDNGKEFINKKMINYCKEQEISFTRSRPYKKNDQAHIEGKNFQSIRKLIGYERITEKEIVELINDIYQSEHRLLTNYFYTTQKLKKKQRVGTRIKKIYEEAKTPYQRVLESNSISKETKLKLSLIYLKLNPVELNRSLNLKLKRVFKLISVSKLNQATPIKT